MIEEQVLSYILDTKDWDFVKKNNINESYFKAYPNEFLFVAKHVAKYGTTPDLTTFLSTFEDFDLFEISESKDYLLEKLREERCFDLIVGSINNVNDLSKTNSFDALKAMKDSVEKIEQEIRGRGLLEGYDLIKKAFERAEEYRKRLSTHGLMGIPSNFLDLDKYTHGWLDEDFISLTARTGEGKSWIILYLGIQAWLAQKRVVHFSLENSKIMTGFRFDTLLGHFSNDGLMSGAEVLEWNHKKLPAKTKDDYFDFVKDLNKYDIPYHILDAQDNGDEQFSPEQIFDISDRLGADIILVDQLSLLRPDRPKKTIREGYVSITRSCRRATNEMKKPIILNSQSSREAAKDAKKNPDSTPDLHQMMESDSIPQDSTRVLAIKQMEGLLRLDLKKNTYGKSGFKGVAKWDIDLGIVKPIDITGANGDKSMF